MTAPISACMVDSAISIPMDQIPPVIGEVTLRELCTTALIQKRVTESDPPRILFHAGRDHYRMPGEYFVGIGRTNTSLTKIRALRVLEVLAYGFLDYGARECVCDRGLFFAAKPRGRPALSGGRAMTPAERMRTMRERRRAASAT